MSLRGAAFLAGAYEHPRRVIPDRSLTQIHAEVAVGAVADAGLELSDVDGLFCDSEAPGFGAVSVAEYLGLNPRYLDTTEMGGASYLSHVGHAAAAIAAGRCRVALVTLAGKPRTGGSRPGGSMRFGGAPEAPFELPYGPTVVAMYALAARRHMYEYGTTSAQLAEVRAAASWHASVNPHAFLPHEVGVADVLASPVISDPLHRLDCCVITDGGGAIVVVAPDVARALPRRCVRLLGWGEGVKHTGNGRVDLTWTAAARSGPAAFAEAGLTPGDVDYASLYDSFTITVVQAVEDLGFCAKGRGGAFVSDGALRAPDGVLPFNTDGGGLCNNHPGNRGGMTKIIEAVRQLRGEAHPAVQVARCDVALVHAFGGSLGSRMGAATLLLGQADA